MFLILSSDLLPYTIALELKRAHWIMQVIGSPIVVYLAIIPRARVGHEMIDRQRGP